MKKIIFCALGLILSVACGNKNEIPGRDELADDIAAREQALASFAVASNIEQADSMIALYQMFFNNYPDDSLAPIYMMRAAEIQINTGSFEEGISTLDSIMALYPGFEDLAVCQFLKGTAYEQNQQYDLAREAYTEFITNYPDHVLAADTRKMLPFIGLTPEEQLEAIMAQNHNK